MTGARARKLLFLELGWSVPSKLSLRDDFDCCSRRCRSDPLPRPWAPLASGRQSVVLFAWAAGLTGVECFTTRHCFCTTSCEGECIVCVCAISTAVICCQLKISGTEGSVHHRAEIELHKTSVRTLIFALRYDACTTRAAALLALTLGAGSSSAACVRECLCDEE